MRRGPAPLNTRAAVLSPSGRRIAFDAQGRIEVHDLTDGRTRIPPGSVAMPSDGAVRYCAVREAFDAAVVVRTVEPTTPTPTGVRMK